MFLVWKFNRCSDRGVLQFLYGAKNEHIQAVELYSVHDIFRFLKLNA